LANHPVGVYVDSGSTATLESMLWHGNTANWSGGGTIIHSNDHSGDPAFVNPAGADYHIGAHSAAIDRGIDAGLIIDIDGEPRPAGAGYDIGADEYHHSALDVTKQAYPDPVQPGSSLTYTIRVANTGSVTLTATITDTLPDHITLGRTPAGTLILPGEVVTWTPVSILPQGVWTDTVVVTVEHGYTGPLVNVVQVTTAEGAAGAYTKTSQARDRTCWVRLNDSPADYTSVQDAVDAAQEGDLVRVAGHCTGVNMRPCNDITTTGVVTQVVYISKTVTIQGGYTTTNWTMPDPDTNPTTLDAQGQGRVFYISGDISTTIEGLHITGGDSNEGGGGVGSGAYIITATATISHNWIYSNINGHGAGLYLYRSNALLSGNTISNNVTTDAGGGLFMHFSDTTLRGNTIAANTASLKGGGLYSYAGISSLENNSFTDNTTDGGGGGLYIEGTAATLNGNQVTSNTADSGGGLFLLFHSHMLTSNTVAHNIARSQGSGLLLLASNTTLVNNLVVGNRASGSVVYLAASSPHLLHNTIADNPGSDRGVYLAQEWGVHSTATFTNNILANHPVGVYVDSGSTATLESMLWHGNTANWSGGGTIIHSNDHSGDPAFVDPAGTDYHIGPSSAARDEGVDAGVTEDIDGDLRIDGHPDIGADELTAALIATKRADPDPVAAGSRLTYTISVINAREVTVTTTVTDTLPVHILPGETTDGKVILPGGFITWTAVAIAPVGVWTETVIVTVDVGYAGPLTNVVQVTTEEGVTGVYTETSTVIAGPSVYLPLVVRSAQTSYRGLVPDGFLVEGAPGPYDSSSDIWFNMWIHNTGGRVEYKALGAFVEETGDFQKSWTYSHFEPGQVFYHRDHINQFSSGPGTYHLWMRICFMDDQCFNMLGPVAVIVQ
jgi:uncharacterized repeat protein (TIGR01451 family)